MHAGDIYTIAGPGQGTCSGNGGPATSATIGGDLQLATDQAGDTLLLTAGKQCRLRLVAGQTRTLFGAKRQAGHIYTVYDGTKGCPACAPASLVPRWLAFDRAGNALFATSGKIAVVAARTGTFYGQHLTAGKTYVITGNGTATADGTPIAKAKLTPRGLAVDSRGDIITGNHVIAQATGTRFGKHLTAGRVYSLAQDEFVQAVDSHGNVIVIAPDSEVQVIAATTGTFYGQPMTAGQAFTVAGDGSKTRSGDGGPATDAGISPDSVAVDSAGNLIIGDNAQVPHVPNLEVTTVRVVAAASGTFYGQAMTAGDIYTVAGGGTSVATGAPALDTGFGNVIHVAVAPGGQLLVADSQSAAIRELS